jgi:hypothetical protein
MSNRWSRTYWTDLGERVGATFIATLIPLYVATSNAFQLDWTTDLEIAASAAGLSLLKGLAANLANPDSGPSLLPSPPAPEVEPDSVSSWLTLSAGTPTGSGRSPVIPATDTPHPAAVADLGQRVAEGARQGIAAVRGTYVRVIPRTDPRLGRAVEHDPRSRAFPAPATAPIVSKTWRH